LTPSKNEGMLKKQKSSRENKESPEKIPETHLCCDKERPKRKRDGRNQTCATALGAQIDRQRRMRGTKKNLDQEPRDGG